EPSFLFPSILNFDKQSDIVTWPDEESAPTAVPIRYLKMALYASLRGRKNDRWIDPIARIWPEDDSDELENKIESLTAVYLGGVIRRCVRNIRQRLPEFGGSEDIWTVNLAVPVAHAQDEDVEEAFHHCLGLAWRFAQEKHIGPRSLEQL